MNRIYASLTLLLALSCPARGMEVSSQSSQGSGSGSANQSSSPQLAPAIFPHEIWDEIMCSYCTQVKPRSHANMIGITLVCRTWTEILNDNKYAVLIDVSTWSPDRINEFLSYFAKNPDKAHKVSGLDCHKNQNITEAVIQNIVDTFPHLESLHLRTSHCFTDWNNSGLTVMSDFGAIAKLTNLKEFNVTGAMISSADLRAIVRANQNLEKLHLRSCPSLSDDDFAYIAQQLTKLKKLDASNTKISAAGLQAIAKANPELEELNIYGVNDISGICQLPVDALVCIAQLTKLKKLDVGSTNINAAALQAIVGAVHGLEELNLWGCKSLSGDDFACIAQLTKLKKLNVDFTKISAAGLQAIAGTVHGLEELNLHYCSQLSGVDLAHIAQLTNLKKLNVDYTDISAAVLLAIVMANPNLEELNLYSCAQLPGNAFGHIARLKKLKKLDVDETRISAAALNAIVRANQDLEKLIFPGWSIDKATIGAIKRAHPQGEIFI